MSTKGALFRCHSPTSTRAAKSNIHHRSRNNGISPSSHTGHHGPALTGTNEPLTHVGKQHTTPAPKGHWGKWFLSHRKMMLTNSPCSLE